MAGPRPLSGSLRNHANNAAKSRSQPFKSGPKIKKDTFVGDDSSDSSDSNSDSDSGSDSDVKNESAVDFTKRISTPTSKGKTDGAKVKADTKLSKATTPAKSPTVNGLGASVSKKKELSAKNIKQENKSSGSESDSDSESSSDEKAKKPIAKGEQVKKEDTSSASESGSDSGSDSESSSDEQTKKPKESATKGKQVKKEDSSSSSESASDSESSSEKPKKATIKGKQVKKSESSSESETSSASESDSESDKAKKPTSKSPVKSSLKTKSPVKAAPKPAAKAKSPAKKETSSRSETSSTDSESEDNSEDASQQIEQQIRNELKSAESQPYHAQASEPSKKKAKRAKSVSEDEDGDIEMMDQSMALTNGGNPTNVGDVPEFVAPDFHLRKLEGDSSAADVAKFFSKAQLEGKQVWYITAPASLPVTVVQDLSVPMDQAQQGATVLSHNGEDYRMAFDNPSASSSFRLLIPNKKGNAYSLLERPVNQTMHFTRSETFPPEGPSSVVTTQTISTTKPARPQPEGLRARYTPLGVPAPRPTIAAPTNKAVASIAANNSTPSKSSSKKKRKHTDDGEDGSVATAITTPVPIQIKGSSTSSNKNPPAEKSAKKQKTSRDGTPKRETPVPLPLPLPLPQISSSNGNVGYSGAQFTSASQPLPRSRMSASPGAAIPATQVPVRYTPIPAPTIPGSDGLASSSNKAIKEREKEAKRAEKERKKAEKEAEKAEKARKKAEKEAARAAKSPKKTSSSQIPVPRFDGTGRPIM